MQLICWYQFSSPVKEKEKMYIPKCNNISKILRKKIPRKRLAQIISKVWLIFDNV